MFLTDRGIPAPRALIARLRALISSSLPVDNWIRLVAVAEALACEDDARLSVAHRGGGRPWHDRARGTHAHCAGPTDR